MTGVGVGSVAGVGVGSVAGAGPGPGPGAQMAGVGWPGQELGHAAGMAGSGLG